MTFGQRFGLALALLAIMLGILIIAPFETSALSIMMVISWVVGIAMLIGSSKE